MDVRGYCVVLDLLNQDTRRTSAAGAIPRTSGWKLLRSEISNVCSFFKNLRYKVKKVSANADEATKKDLETIKADITSHHDSIVFILVGKMDKYNKENQTKKFNDLIGAFCDCTHLTSKPKILLQHLIEKVSEEESEAAGYEPPPPPNEIIHVISKIIGDEDNIQNSKSLFLESLVDTIERFGHQLNLIDLFTEITYDVEIEQYHKNEAEKKQVFQTVIFDIPMDETPMTFKFLKDNKATIELPKRVLKNRLELKTKLHFEVAMDLEGGHSYKMARNPRGFCVIINSSNNRTGARIDELSMKHLFEELMFTVRIIRNKRHHEIKKRLKEIASEITHDHQCLFLFLMAHGGKEDNAHIFGDVGGSRRQSTYIYEAFDGDHCTNLLGRPKIFIVQTCMGGSTMPGINKPVTVAGGDGEIYFYRPDNLTNVHPNLTIQENRRAAHAMSDTCIYHATLFGHINIRNPGNGSLLIQAIDHIFREYCAEKDLQHLFSLVSGKVTEGPSPVLGWQQPAVRDGVLNKSLNLNPGFQEEDQTGRYNSDADTLHVNGSAVWFTYDSQTCIVADENTLELQQIDLTTQRRIKYFKPNLDDEYERIIKGIALDSKRHIVLATRRGPDLPTRSVCIVSTTSRWQGLWSVWVIKVVLKFNNPIAICEVYTDSVGILSEQPAGGAMLSIFSRQSLPTGNVQTTVNLPYGDTHQNDLISVSGNCVMVFQFQTGTIYEIGLNGNQKNRQKYKPKSEDSRPCVVTKDEHEETVLVCKTGIYKYHQSHNNPMLLTQSTGVQDMCYNSKYTILAHHKPKDTAKGAVGVIHSPATTSSENDTSKKTSEAKSMHTRKKLTLPRLNVFKKKAVTADEPESTQPPRPDVLLTKGPQKLGKKLKLKCKDEGYSIWRCIQDNQVIIGGMLKPTLTVLGPGGVISRHELERGGTIQHGLCIDSKHQLINVDDLGVCCVALDLDSTKSTTLQPLTRLNTGVDPYHLFHLTTFRFGVYYRETSNPNKSSSQTSDPATPDSDIPCHVDIYSLRDILTSKTDPAPTRTITLDRHGSASYDEVSIDADDNLCVSSWEDHTVYIYTQTGEYMRTVGERRGGWHNVVGGRLYFPRSIQCYHDGSMVVMCRYGDIHRRDPDGSWTLIKQKGGREIYRAVITRHYLWIVHYDDKNISMYKTQ